MAYSADVTYNNLGRYRTLISDAELDGQGVLGHQLFKIIQMLQVGAVTQQVKPTVLKMMPVLLRAVINKQ